MNVQTNPFLNVGVRQAPVPLNSGIASQPLAEQPSEVGSSQPQAPAFQIADVLRLAPETLNTLSQQVTSQSYQNPGTNAQLGYRLNGLELSA